MHTINNNMATLLNAFPLPNVNVVCDRSEEVANGVYLFQVK